jgi:hypothetical protein
VGKGLGGNGVSVGVGDGVGLGQGPGVCSVWTCAVATPGKDRAAASRIATFALRRLFIQPCSYCCSWWEAHDAERPPNLPLIGTKELYRHLLNVHQGRVSSPRRAILRQSMPDLEAFARILESFVETTPH